jgi:hypothetical protein
MCIADSVFVNVDHNSPTLSPETIALQAPFAQAIHFNAKSGSLLVKFVNQTANACQETAT